MTREVSIENRVCRIKFTIRNFHALKDMIIVAIFLSSILLFLQSVMYTLVLLAYITRYYTTKL